MKKLNLLFVVIMLFSNIMAQDLSLFEVREASDGNITMPYRILFPENTKKGEKYPLFLFLHGNGMRGTDNESQLKRGGFLFVDSQNRKNYPCIALYPQAPVTGAFDGYWAQVNGEAIYGNRTELIQKYGEENVKSCLSPYGLLTYDIIQQLIKQNIVDTDRIYISGSSMGGITTYVFLSEYPDMFAAAGPICGRADLGDISKWAGKVPVWIFHGDEDDLISVETARDVVEKLKELGATNYKYSEYKGVKHGSWTNAFAEPDYLNWFFSQSKTKNK